MRFVVCEEELGDSGSLGKFSNTAQWYSWNQNSGPLGTLATLCRLSYPRMLILDPF